MISLQEKKPSVKSSAAAIRNRTAVNDSIASNTDRDVAGAVDRARESYDLVGLMDQLGVGQPRH